ncbi:UDP-glucose 4-epimerase [Ferriphaselus amnicola]|uniref:UDP-glucose 4-epimerase n=1 Tax=Ferriphaselus amnicola TaxID=1188319 RepID=A0A2Z6GC57_9PROT|nr:SDR family oxidoreductase [Ferriphaselus amnicola]BBE51027.1 UDP-glucose 4-epimerase [Ferriphaselus amnicola]
MRAALITGARGFVGQHLAYSLKQQGYKVCGMGHGAWTEFERAAWGVDYWLNGEVSKRNLDIVQAEVGKPDVVYHLAGGSSVGPSLVAPEEDFRRSVLSAAELLEWARLAAPEVRLVMASSAAVYGAGHTQSIRESDSLSPYSPYGTHKRIAEELFESYGKNFGLNVAMVRLFSVYGTELKKQLLWDSCRRLVKDASRLMLGGSGNEARDWFHISDAVALLQVAADHACAEGLIVNGGTGISTSVRQVAVQLCASWGMDTQVEFSGQSRAGDPQFLVADVAHATSLGFMPKMGWQSGVSDYVEWFKRVNGLVSV